ncbi:ascorbate peroxidase [Canna indica]|uniref:L-ascorbate peroxidase n=1 Tax=Canna indica TaxID=4628 RepID=A0AAQ3K5D1_9LILI|nr:ascorbate peroxidase [Canna indica]
MNPFPPPAPSAPSDSPPTDCEDEKSFLQHVCDSDDVDHDRPPSPLRSRDINLLAQGSRAACPKVKRTRVAPTNEEESYSARVEPASTFFIGTEGSCASANKEDVDPNHMGIKGCAAAAKNDALKEAPPPLELEVEAITREHNKAGEMAPASLSMASILKPLIDLNMPAPEDSESLHHQLTLGPMPVASRSEPLIDLNMPPPEHDMERDTAVHCRRLKHCLRRRHARQRSRERRDCTREEAAKHIEFAHWSMAQQLSASSSAALLPAASKPAAPRPSAALLFLPSHHHRFCRSFPSSCSLRPIPSLRPVSSSRRPAIGSRRATSIVCAASDSQQLISAREDIKELLRTTFCHPILVRLGWHDAGTFDKNIEDWPKCGGANGSLRFEIELKHAANAGLVNALKLLQPIKDKYSGITYADLFQLASATAIEEAGGPKIPMKYGRVDVSGPEQCPDEGRLPDAGPPSPAGHLRNVFYRMGLDDKDIVALSGAHTLGRSRPERSGWGKGETKYTKDGPGAPGGQSWTVKWLKFDNSYFKDIKERKDEDLLVLPTDAALFEDAHFKVYAEKYAEDQNAFFKDYAVAHAKLSNLGAKFVPPEGITIDNDTKNTAPELSVAAKKE